MLFSACMCDWKKIIQRFVKCMSVSKSSTNVSNWSCFQALETLLDQKFPLFRLLKLSETEKVTESSLESKISLSQWLKAYVTQKFQFPSSHCLHHTPKHAYVIRILPVIPFDYTITFEFYVYFFKTLFML